MAYESMEGGQLQTYVMPLSGSGRKWQISTELGANPFWSHDSRQLFFEDGRGVVHVVDVESRDGQFVHGTPEPLFEISPDTLESIRSITPDGRFLVIEPIGGPKRHAINLILDWR